MLLEIKDLIASSFPKLVNEGLCSVIRIQCTKPVYLLFCCDCEFPAYVAKVGESRWAHELYEKSIVLQQRFVEKVANPVGVIEIDDLSSIFLQTGVAGVPWFKIREKLPFSKAVNLSLECVKDFHAVVKSHDDWNCLVVPSELLNDMGNMLYLKGIIDDSLRDYISLASCRLRVIDGIDGFWQHGDFCLNNLIFNGDQFRIIDFDDFGESQVPMLDFFCLARSVREIYADDFDDGQIDRMACEYIDAIRLPRCFKGVLKELCFFQTIFGLTQAVKLSRVRQIHTLRHELSTLVTKAT